MIHTFNEYWTSKILTKFDLDSLNASEEEWKLLPTLTPTQLKYYMTNFRKHTGKIGYQKWQIDLRKRSH